MIEGYSRILLKGAIFQQEACGSALAPHILVDVRNALISSSLCSASLLFLSCLSLPPHVPSLSNASIFFLRFRVLSFPAFA
jgi:hypothetical protein